MFVRARWASTASRLVDVILMVWIGCSRILIVGCGLGLMAYWVARPLQPASAGEGGAVFSWWAELSSWPTLVWNTFVVSGTAASLSLVVAIPVAFLLFRTDLPARRWFTGGLLLPACLPVFVSASAILSLIGTRAWEGNAFMAGVIHGWLGIPLAIVLLGVGYRGIDGNIEEAAALDAGWARVCLRLDPSLILWSILGVAVIQTWVSATDIAVSDLLAIRTLAEEVYVTFQLSRSASAQALVVVPYVALFGVLVLGVARAARRVDLHVEQAGRRPPHMIRLGRWRWPLWSALLLLLGVMILMPVVWLMGEVESVGQFWRGVGKLCPELWDSSLLAGASALAIMSIVLGAGDLAIAAGRRAQGLRWALVLLLALPTPCLAIALLEILNQPGWLGRLCDSFFLPVFGQTLRWLPLGMLIASPGFMSVSRDLREAARIDGCNLAGLHRRLFWPMSHRFLALAGVAMVILVCGELTASVLLSQPIVLPLSVRFFTLVHYGLSGQAATICLLVIFVMVIPWSVLVRLLHQRD
ncbi:MAG: iron ABC transporter permease [Phycisphaerae bacterium]|nr:iron ABC transporter permease [Phycisphaerae bacterium]